MQFQHCVILHWKQERVSCLQYLRWSIIAFFYFVLTILTYFLQRAVTKARCECNFIANGKGPALLASCRILELILFSRSTIFQNTAFAISRIAHSIVLLRFQCLSLFEGVIDRWKPLDGRQKRNHQTFFYQWPSFQGLRIENAYMKRCSSSNHLLGLMMEDVKEKPIFGPEARSIFTKVSLLAEITTKQLSSVQCEQFQHPEIHFGIDPTRRALEGEEERWRIIYQLCCSTLNVFLGLQRESQS